MAKRCKHKFCKRYSCIFHPGEHAGNNCDYYLIMEQDRVKDSEGVCQSYKKATPSQRKQLNTLKLKTNWYKDATHVRNFIQNL